MPILDAEARDRVAQQNTFAQEQLLRALHSASVAAGISVAEVAARLAVDEQVVVGLEGGDRVPGLRELRLWALSIGVHVDYLVAPDRAVGGSTDQRVKAAGLG